MEEIDTEKLRKSSSLEESSASNKTNSLLDVEEESGPAVLCSIDYFKEILGEGTIIEAPNDTKIFFCNNSLTCD